VKGNVLTASKIIIPTVCAALAFSPVPAAANDAIKILGGIAIGAAIGSAVKGQQQQKQQQQQQVRRAPDPQRQRNRETQTALNAFGFEAGGVDGVLGPGSRAAISRYQAYMGYPATGHLTDYERATLVEGYNRYNAGGGQAYPEVVANEGTRGLLKAFSDPNYVNRYRQTARADTGTVDHGGGNATIGTNGALPALDLTRGSAPVSMATHCEVVAGMSQVNGGAILASDVADPDQALGEQFCEARSYAMTQGQALMTNARATEDQMNALCTQIADNMAPAVNAVATETAKVVTTRATEIANKIYGGDMAAASGYGEICLGTGYRQDDAAIALGGALSLVAAGQVPYAEIMGHHARWGFGMPQASEASQVWYRAALTAMDDGAPPAFLPSKTAERNAVIRAALSGGNRAAPVEVRVGGSEGGLALPALNLGD
jgi:hypothetical protein